MAKSLCYQLLDQKLPKEELAAYLKDLTPKKLKDLEEEMEYYLLCYPQGTGDADLEDLLCDLSDYFYPEEG